ncbi:MAG: proline racemase family protein [Planctomycetia bacterium]|nr:proline racemase family protein [Planctomycetia bacterium]
MISLEYVDSHTGGEPTRIIIGGAPVLPGKNVAEQRLALRDQYDWIRSASVNEPRGSNVLVGALLLPALENHHAAGIIFFNNVSVLNMCGHGTIGLLATLKYLDRIKPGRHGIETCVGTVEAILHNSNRVTVRNVPSYRFRKDVAIDVSGYGRVVGDIAWGGNWFFLVHQHKEQLELKHAEKLLHVTWQIRLALEAAGITGKDGGEIDHIELFGPSSQADSKNFVLCPGRAYDRSPCGTGTSAKLACLAADGKLKPGQVWKQESIIGSVFEGTYELEGDCIIPSITGEAFITGRGVLLLDDKDPYRDGIVAR